MSDFISTAIVLHPTLTGCQELIGDVENHKVVRVNVSRHSLPLKGHGFKSSMRLQSIKQRRELDPAVEVYYRYDSLTPDKVEIRLLLLGFVCLNTISI